MDDDYYWRNGWYDNPGDPRLFVQDRFNSMNYTTNVGKPAGRYMFGGICIVVVVLFVLDVYCLFKNGFYTDSSCGRWNGSQNYFRIYEYNYEEKEIRSVKLLENWTAGGLLQPDKWIFRRETFAGKI